MGASKRLFEKVNTHVENLKYNLEHGEELPVDIFLEAKQAHAEYKKISDLYEGFIKENIEEFETHIREYPEGHRGFEFVIKNGKTTYNYKNCPEWVRLDTLRKNEEARLKNLYNVSIKGDLIASKDGEEIILPSKKISAPSISIKPKKS